MVGGEGNVGDRMEEGEAVVSNVAVMLRRYELVLDPTGCASSFNDSGLNLGSSRPNPHNRSVNPFIIEL